jgi:hypothetical protein
MSVMPHCNFGSSPRKTHKVTQDAAESIAIEVLGFLGGDPARLDRFLALSGLTIDNLRAAAKEPGFLAAVLDYLAADEAALLAFASGSGHEPSTLMRAREILSPQAEQP